MHRRPAFAAVPSPKSHSMAAGSLNAPCARSAEMEVIARGAQLCHQRPRQRSPPARVQPFDARGLRQRGGAYILGRRSRRSTLLHAVVFEIERQCDASAPRRKCDGFQRMHAGGQRTSARCSWESARRSGCSLFARDALAIDEQETASSTQREFGCRLGHLQVARYAAVNCGDWSERPDSVLRQPCRRRNSR